MGGEALPEHIVDRYPVKVGQTWIQGVWDNPVRFEELHKRLQFRERGMSPQRTELGLDDERK